MAAIAKTTFPQAFSWNKYCIVIQMLFISPLQYSPSCNIYFDTIVVSQTYSWMCYLLYVATSCKSTIQFE